MGLLQPCCATCRQDLERMRQPAGVLSSEEITRLRHEAEAELEGQRAVAQARKEKMLKVAMPPLLLPLDYSMFGIAVMFISVEEHHEACPVVFGLLPLFLSATATLLSTRIASNHPLLMPYA